MSNRTTEEEIQEALSELEDSLESKEKNYCLSRVLPRLATREQFIQRLYMFCALRRGKDNQLRYLFSKDNMAKHPIALVDNPNEWVRSETFFWVTSRFTHIIWQLLYLGLLIADLGDLVQMGAVTYRSSLGYVLVGLANNIEPYDASLTSTLGNNRPDTAGFWFGFSALYLLPILLGAIISSVNAKGDNQSLPNCTVFSAEPGSFMRNNRDQMLLSNVRYEDYSAIEGQQFIENDRSERNIIRLARYAYCYERISNYPKENTYVIDFVEKKLESSRKCYGKAICLSPLYAAYLHWSLGASERLSDHIAFNLIVTTFNVLATWDFWRMLVVKIITVVNYSVARLHCESTGWYYSWLQPLGTYRCDPCELDYVDVNSRHTVAGCFNRTLAYPRRIDELQSALDSIGGDLPYLEQLKLSYQNWTTCRATELKNLLGSLSQRFSNVSSFDISKEQLTIALPWQADLVADFINNITEMLSFNAAEIVWSNESLAKLAESVSKHSLQELVLDNSDLNTTGLSLWMQAASNNTKYISVQGANLKTNASLISSWPKLVNCQYISFSGCSFSQLTLDSVSDWVAISAPKALVFSGVNLGQFNLTRFLLASQNVRELQLANCNLDDAVIMDLAIALNQSSVESLDLSSNRMSYLGLLHLESLVLRLQVLNLAYNTFQSGIYELSQWIQVARMQGLHLAGLDITVAEQKQLLQAIANSTVTELTTSDMGIMDDTVIAAVQGFKASNHTLSYWDLSYNHLSNTSLAGLFDWTPHLGLTVLKLAGNDLSSPIAQLSWQKAVSSQSSLTLLDLRLTDMSDDNGLSLITSLSTDSALTDLVLADNQFTDETFKNMVRNLRSAPEYLRELDQNKMDNADNNYANYMGASENSRLEKLDISGISVSIHNMREFCQGLAYMNPLGVMGVLFDDAQLGMSSAVDIEGCPAAVSGSAALTPNMLCIFGMLLMHLCCQFFSKSNTRFHYHSNLYRHVQFSATAELLIRR